jgi:hypothetical protein
MALRGVGEPSAVILKLMAGSVGRWERSGEIRSLSWRGNKMREVLQLCNKPGLAAYIAKVDTGTGEQGNRNRWQLYRSKRPCWDVSMTRATTLTSCSSGPNERGGGGKKWRIELRPGKRAADRV